MDPSAAFALLPAIAALLVTGRPLVLRRLQAHAARQAEIRYVEALLAEARKCTFPAPSRRV